MSPNSKITIVLSFSLKTVKVNVLEINLVQICTSISVLSRPVCSLLLDLNTLLLLLFSDGLTRFQLYLRAAVGERVQAIKPCFQGINRWSSPPRCSILGVKTCPLPFLCFYSIPVQLSSALFDTASKMSESDKSKELQGIFNSFYLRASEAEERLSKLEISVASKKEGGDEELLKVMQLKLEDARAEQISERQLAAKEIQKLSVENAKLQYRITHLVRALKDADAKLDI